MKIEIDINEEVADHMLNDECGAKSYADCAFRESVMFAVWTALKASRT